MTWSGGFQNPVAELLPGQVTTQYLADGAVTEDILATLAVSASKLADEAVQTAKLADNAVSTPKVQDVAIVRAKIGLAAIGAAQIEDAVIGTAKIADAAITNAKIDSLSADKITAGDITGLRYRTAASGERLEIRGDTGESFIRFYNTGGFLVGEMGYTGTLMTVNTVGPVNELVLSGGSHSIWIGPTETTLGYTEIGGNLRFLGNKTISVDGTLLDINIAGQVAQFREAGIGSPALTLSAAGANYVALRFATERSWIFYQTGTGSGADLSLLSEAGGKTFHIRAFNGNPMFSVGTSNDVYSAAIYDSTTASGANIHISGSGAHRMYRATSSKEYKTAIRPYDGRHSTRDLTPSLYRSKATADDGRKVRLGLIAEDVRDNFPMAFMAPDGIDWNPLIADIIYRLNQLEKAD